MLKDAIMATLSYYDCFGHPLTAFELHRYLINPQRLSRKPVVVDDISLVEVLAELDWLGESGVN